MNSVQSQNDVEIQMPTPNPDEMLVQISLAEFGGETSSAERAAVAGLLMQAAQLIGSGSVETNLRDNQGRIVGRYMWGTDTVTGTPPEEPPPEEVEPPPEQPAVAAVIAKAPGKPAVAAVKVK